MVLTVALGVAARGFFNWKLSFTIETADTEKDLAGLHRTAAQPSATLVIPWYHPSTAPLRSPCSQVSQRFVAGKGAVAPLPAGSTRVLGYYGTRVLWY